MNRLVKNELKKIFSKKAMYVLLIVTIVFMGVINFLNFKFKSDDNEYIVGQAEAYEAELNSSVDLDPEYKKDAENYLEAYKLMQHYGLDSWQTYIIQNRVVGLISSMREDGLAEFYDEYKKEYDDLIARFDNGDWRSFVQEELDDVNDQLEMDADDWNVKDAKQVLEWRLEYDIPYGNSPLNTYLTSWYSARQNVRDFEARKDASYQDKVSNDDEKATIAICEYAIKNRCDYNLGVEGDYSIKNGVVDDAKISLLKAVDQYSLFILIAIAIIAGTIVSEEFNKGTIKLLLVRPYSRVKILLAKFVASLIIMFAAILTVVLAQTIIGGVLYGFGIYTTKCVVYNIVANSLSEVSLFKYLCMIIGAKLPMFILILTLSFTISTVFTNAPLAIAIPLVGMTFESLINQLAYMYEKARFLMYFVTPNWDFTQYVFGGLSQMKGVTLPFSICICLAYFIVMMALSLYSFKNRNIKNV